MTFEEYVSQWDDLVGQIAALKKQLKPLTDGEMAMRKAIVKSVAEALGSDWKEGTNTFKLADGRVLKIGYKLTREVAAAELPAAREEYALLNDAPVAFDDLLRVKYELDLREFRKLEGQAAKVFSRVVTTKEAAPEVEIR